MESSNSYIFSVKQDSPEEEEVLPSLIKFISTNQVTGFDKIIENNTIATETVVDFLVQSQQSGESNFANHKKNYSISISMPTSPTGGAQMIKDPKRVCFDVVGGNSDSSSSSSSSSSGGAWLPKYAKSQSQPIRKGTLVEGSINHPTLVHHPSIVRLKDNRFDSFKTWSGKLERQISNLRGRPRETKPEDDVIKQKSEMDSCSLPVDRYYDALEGPELDKLRPSEEIVLPNDKTWPFLLRYPISSFGICLGVSSQAILWKTMATSASTKFLHITTSINYVLWCISVALVIIIASIYLLKVIFFFEAVRREYYHPIRVNFFFAPWISLLFLAIGVPPSITENLPHALWYVLMIPIFCIELKLYGQWMSGGQRRLSKVANPSNHLSVVGNFVGALLGASMGLREGPIFFFAVGLAHYTVLFVTLYQRLPTNETLPKELHPVFFLFVAAPSVASMAWAKLQGSFDVGSRIAYFIAMFLYFSLAVRINFFRGFKFSLAWWAYTFPMTGAAIATIRYSNEVTTVVTQCLAVMLTAISTLTVTALLVTTIVHAFVFRNLFPNDIAIAISETKKKHHLLKWFHMRNGSSDYNDIGQYLTISCSDGKDSEACTVKPPTSNETVIDDQTVEF
ncbi:hypothetical protein LWI28_020656 [Acer negundo]|uniref:Uncharacterized protein n=1 Tax=Acer negundo TaxID=4023 RepID=A0AAD5NII4_ACENE|nr:hypothetical protein LWI28_020656 [Acer negundo]KAK4837646.1 hypothetical protein QYF36_007259 [Acer negundo]